MTDALLGLGSNLGDPQENLTRAIALLRAAPGIENVVVSRPLKTSPIGGPAGQSEFLNAAARLSTSLSAIELLDALQAIESQLGRVRDEHWGPRMIDLDLLLFGEEIIDTPRLVVPHPRLATRKFALAPAIEVAAEMRHPQIGWTIGELLAHLQTAPPYFAVTGENITFVAQVAGDAASATGGQLIERPPVEVAASHSQRLEFLTQAAQRLPSANAIGPRTVVSALWLNEAFVGKASDQQRSELQAIVRHVAVPKLLAIAGRSELPTRFQGPILQLPAERAAAAQELIAAIEAMQS
jgi:2-amino-4-hydroxy-6-hydroxymethyldihydropteridine diphosphokinase